MSIKRLQYGFTLIELLVVIAIIGILAAIGAVGYSKYNESANTAAVSANLNNVASALNADVTSLSIGNKVTTDFSSDREDDTCEEIAIAVVKKMNQTMKNPYGGSAAGYGNFMTGGGNGLVTQNMTPKKGSIIVSCSIPNAKPTGEEFLIYECSCNSDSCSFDEECKIPSPSPNLNGLDPYTLEPSSP